jgi:beta-glucanase (GH16 family)
MKRAFLLMVLLGAWAGCSVQKDGLAVGASDQTGAGGGINRDEAGAGNGGTASSGGTSGEAGAPGGAPNRDAGINPTALPIGGGAPGSDTKSGSAGVSGGAGVASINMDSGSAGVSGGAGAPSIGTAPGPDSGSNGDAGNTRDSGSGSVDAPVLVADSANGVRGEAGSTDAPVPNPVLGSVDAGGSADSVRQTGDDAGKGASDGPGRRLVWSDEFNLGADIGADTTKWNVATWEPNTVNSEKQKYTARSQNVFHDGQGHLVLRGLHDSWSSDGTVYPYTSGRLQTDGKFQFKFGRIEVSAKLPAGKGSFPAILLMGTTGSWPQCGEIGLLEQWGQDKSWLYCSTYAGDASGDIGNQKAKFTNATTASSDFHLYALDWYPDHMIFFIDDVQVARSDFRTSSPFYSNNFYLILDVAIGGTMGGAIDDTNGFPMDMVLDYVRVYSQ